jgi:hypothetical protein
MHVHEKYELGKPFNQQKKIKRDSKLSQNEMIMFKSYRFQLVKTSVGIETLSSTPR